MRLLIRLILLTLCLAAGFFGFTRWRDGADPSAVEAELATVRFSYAPAHARDEATMNGGPSDRLAFAARFPDFAPLPRAHAPLAAAAEAELRKATVFVTLTARDDSPDPAERPSQLYARFLTGDAQAGPGGLVSRRFEAGSPYEQEQLFVAPPDGRSFFARCPKMEARGDAPGNACLWLFRDGRLDVELRFAPALLGHWQTIAEAARGFLAHIKAGGRPKKSRAVQ